MAKHFLSLIIPTYNEAKNLPSLVEEIFSRLNSEIVDCEIIIVDDDSPDGTGLVAEELAKSYPIRVIHRSGERGLGNAVRAGFAATNREYIAVMDADLSHDPSILPAMLKALDADDLVIGSRFSKGSEVEDWQSFRKFISHLGVYTARLLCQVKDPLSGYFMMKRSVIEKVALNTKGYKILFEILVKGKYQKVTELPFTFRVRRYSASKLNLKEYLRFLRQIVNYFFHQLLN